MAAKIHPGSAPDERTATGNAPSLQDVGGATPDAARPHPALLTLLVLVPTYVHGRRGPAPADVVGALRGRPPRGLPYAGADAQEPPIPLEEIRRVVLRQIGALNRCRERADAGAPQGHGRYGVRIVIAPSGRVRRVRALAAGSAPALDACVLGLFEAMVFARPRGGAEVSVDYPMSRCGIEEG